MIFNEFKTIQKQIFSKVLNSSKSKKLISLLSKLNLTLTEYIISFKEFVFLKEDKDNTYKELSRKIDYIEKEIKNLFYQIDEFFNEGFFIEITKEQATDISDEYQELINNISSIEITLQSERFKKLVSLTSFYENEIIPNFKKLNRNIKVYNERATIKNWPYKLKTYEEAILYQKDAFDNISNKHKGL